MNASPTTASIAPRIFNRPFMAEPLPDFHFRFLVKSASPGEGVRDRGHVDPSDGQMPGWSGAERHGAPVPFRLAGASMSSPDAMADDQSAVPTRGRAVLP